MNRDIKRITLLILLSLFVVKSYAASNTSERINGVTQFLIDRAHDNYLYIFEKKIKESKSMACYFPTTKKNLEIASLKSLLLSNQLWENSLKKDMKALLTRSTARIISETYSLKSESATTFSDAESASRLIDILQKISIKHKGVYYPVTVIPLDDEELKKKINAFYINKNDLNNAIEYFKRFKGKSFNDGSLCKMDSIEPDEFRKNIESLYLLEDKLKIIKDNISNIKIDPVLGKHFTSKDKIKLFIQSAIGNYTNIEDRKELKAQEKEEQIKKVKELDYISSTFDQQSSNTERAISVLSSLKESSSITIEEFNKLKKYILFFAQISDADEEAVQAILKSYTLPSVSFYEKRNKKNVWLIGAYLGVVGGSSDVPAGEDDGNNFGIFAPIGLEYSNGNKNSGSWSVMLAPFDFGYPVSLKLNGIDKDVNLDDVVAPAIVFSYGVPDLPLSIGLGYQRGRSFTATSDNEEKVFIHFSFDMPLWVL